jgi:hypothetical protein
MFHVQDIHETLEGQCLHGTLNNDREKPILKFDSPPFRALMKIVWDEKLLAEFPHYVNFK